MYLCKLIDYTIQNNVLTTLIMQYFTIELEPQHDDNSY